jgi:hypothetical protein
MRKSLYLAVFVAPLLFPARVLAHIQLSSPVARYVQDNNGLKTGPCGSGTRTGTVTKLVPGQTVTVTWKESVSHAGHYRIGLAASESDFAEPTDLSLPSPLPGWDLVDGIADKTGTQTYTQSVQIPSKECPACVLQLIQVMSAGTDGTNTGSFSGVYHACADVSISAASGDGGAGAEVRASDSSRPDSTPPDGVLVSDAPAVKDTGVAGSGGAGGSSGAGTGGNTSAGTTSAPSGGKSGGSGGASAEPGSGGATTAAGAGGNRSRGAGGSASGGSGGLLASGATGGSEAATHAGSTTGGIGGHASNADGNGGSAGNRGNPATGSGAAAGTSASGCSCHIGHIHPIGTRGGLPGLSWLALAALVPTLRRRRRRG